MRKQRALARHFSDTTRAACFGHGRPFSGIIHPRSGIRCPSPSIIPRHPPHQTDWDKFRPARDLKEVPGRQRRVKTVLVLTTALFFAVLLAQLLRPHIKAALAYVTKVALRSHGEVTLPHTSDLAKRPARPTREDNHGERIFTSPPQLGPFDAYVLDGDRYIRVGGKDSYALMDSKTGKVTWISKAQNRPSANASTAYAKPGKTR